MVIRQITSLGFGAIFGVRELMEEYIPCSVKLR